LFVFGVLFIVSVFFVNMSLGDKQSQSVRSCAQWQGSDVFFDALAVPVKNILPDSPQKAINGAQLLALQSSTNPLPATDVRNFMEATLNQALKIPFTASCAKVLNGGNVIYSIGAVQTNVPVQAGLPAQPTYLACEKQMGYIVKFMVLDKTYVLQYSALEVSP
jgi:hypothetical protein